MADEILFHHRTSMVRRHRLAPGEAMPWHRDPFIELQDILVLHRTPMKKPRYDQITTTIEREWLAQIIAGTKKIEYRQIKPYWTKRFAKVSLPFELRLLNGMNPPVPEVTVLIHKITKDHGSDKLIDLYMKKMWEYHSAEISKVKPLLESDSNWTQAAEEESGTSPQHVVN